MIMRLFSTLLIPGIILAACGTSKKVAVPVTNTSEPAPRLLPELPPSEINIPVKIYMRPLFAVMDSTTAKQFTNETWPGYNQSSCDYRYKYQFVRGPFRFGCANNKVTIAFQGQYRLTGSKCICAFDKQISPWVSGSCGYGSEPMRRVDISIGSSINVLPDHRMRTLTRIDGLNAFDKCQVTVMQTDMTTLVMDSIRASVESYCRTFDSFVQVLNNNRLLLNWRNGGSRVMAVSKYGFLNLNPTQLRISAFNLKQDTLYFSLGFKGTPRFSSDSQRLVTATPLPFITTAEGSPVVSSYVNAVYEYPFFNRLLNDSLRNKPFTVEGRTFVIKSVNIGGSNEGKVKIDLSFTGNRNGTLHLTGTPVLDTATQVLTMPDISFSLESRDILLNMAKGLLRKKIMRQLKGQSVLDVAALIQRNKSVIAARLNQPITPWLSTSGMLQDIRLVGLLPQRDYIQVQAYFRANLVLTGVPPSNLVFGL